MSCDRTYVGLDVSLATTAICVVDDSGAVRWRGSCPSDPAVLAATIRQRAPGAVRIGLETGQTSSFLTLSLRGRGLPVVCLDARHAKAALKMQINKSDANDAHGLAQIVRTGWYREVVVKTMDAQELKMLLVARALLVGQRQAAANAVRGLMKTYGLAFRRGTTGIFATRVREIGDGNAALMAVVEPRLCAWQALREQIGVLDRQLRVRAKTDPVARRLMSVPGVGVVVALAYMAVIDDPARFKHSETVGAYLGLTPCRDQSGETDRVGKISRCGDGLLRGDLFEAATVILQRMSRASSLEAWASTLAKRIGARRAKVALARKLAVLMHRIWVDGTEFQDKSEPKVGAPVAA